MASRRKKTTTIPRQRDWWKQCLSYVAGDGVSATDASNLLSPIWDEAQSLGLEGDERCRWAVEQFNKLNVRSPARFTQPTTRVAQKEGRIGWQYNPFSQPTQERLQYLKTLQPSSPIQFREPKKRATRTPTKKPLYQRVQEQQQGFQSRYQSSAQEFPLYDLSDLEDLASDDFSYQSESPPQQTFSQPQRSYSPSRQTQGQYGQYGQYGQGQYGQGQYGQGQYGQGQYGQYGQGQYGQYGQYGQGQYGQYGQYGQGQYGQRY